MSQNVHRTEQVRDAFGRDQAGKHQPLPESQVAGSLLELRSQNPITDQQEFGLRHRLHNRRGGRQQVVVSLEMKQSRSFPITTVLSSKPNSRLASARNCGAERKGSTSMPL